MRPLRCIAALFTPAFALVGACADLTPEPASLDAIRARTDTLLVVREAESLRVTFSGDYGKEDCPALDLAHLRVTLDGATLDAVSRRQTPASLRPLGGSIETPNPQCAAPSALFTIGAMPTAPSSELVLDDGTAQIQVELHDFFAPLSLTLADAEQTTVRPDEEVTLKILPDTAKIEGARIELRPSAEPTSIDVLDPDTTSSGQLRFTVPSDVPAGTLLVRLVGFSVNGRASCEGVARCNATYSVYDGPTLDVTVAP